MRDRKIKPKTFNEYLTGLHQFFQFLVVRGYVVKRPFQIEYYQKKIIPKHHDRSVSLEICGEILPQLHLLPEHLRCMYLHLWCLGLRISEVCTLKGNAYYWQGEDAWIQVYQIKMKNYKRIPIPEGLYKSCRSISDDITSARTITCLPTREEAHTAAQLFRSR